MICSVDGYHYKHVLTGITIGKAVSRESGGAVTADCVGPHGAHGIGSTGVGSDTGVDTTPVPADLLVPTLAVRRAPWLRPGSCSRKLAMCHLEKFGQQITCDMPDIKTCGMPYLL